MSYPPQRRPRSTQLAGIILFGAFILTVAIVIMVGFLTLGAVISTFDHDTANLNAQALAVYNALKTAATSAFALATTMILIAAVGTLVIAIFALREGSEF